MAHVYHPTPLERRPYIPAGCDQQQRVHDGARAEPPRPGLGAVPVVAVAGGAAIWTMLIAFWS